MALMHNSNKVINAAILFGVLLVALCPVFAATLDDYQKRLEAARMDIIALRRLDDDASGFERLEREKLEDIRRSIPKTEQLELQSGSVATDNQWLHDELGAYLEETDPEPRQTLLLSIEERITAIGEKVGELQEATTIERTKDEDKQKLAEILRREEYQRAEVKDESLFQKWSKAFWDWIATFFPKPSISSPTEPGFGSLKFLLQILIYAAVIGAIGFLLYRFWPLMVGRFGFKTKEKKHDRVILGERIGEDESADDLFSEAERLALDGHLRDAIRKGYIAVLCELSDRKIIGLARHKTNRDYLRDVRKRAGLFENMSGLTGTYERNWYGLRPSEKEDWEDFRDRYKQTMTSAKT
ncbi:MAG: DUF4129 domain-containing protein [Chloracidobacterium sp.]|nr:DUF4129 domain-containing protein [Chloracidobacterium sp.]